MPAGGRGQSNGRVPVSSSATLTSGVAGRYATALFELAKDGDLLDEVERDIREIETIHANSADFREILANPVYTREEQGKALAAIAAAMGLGATVSNTIGLMAKNRRLFVLPGLVAQVKALIAAHRGEVTAEVTAAKKLTKEQTETLARTLKASVGKDVKLDVTVDESLIGGLVVKVGSRMIDTSIRSKLAKLQTVMKEVG
jgi:F-type H+-transporting ATPase subunit delta